MKSIKSHAHADRIQKDQPHQKQTSQKMKRERDYYSGKNASFDKICKIMWHKSEGQWNGSWNQITNLSSRNNERRRGRERPKPRSASVVLTMKIIQNWVVNPANNRLVWICVFLTVIWPDWIAQLAILRLLISLAPIFAVIIPLFLIDWHRVSDVQQIKETTWNGLWLKSAAPHCHKVYLYTRPCNVSIYNCIM